MQYFTVMYSESQKSDTPQKSSLTISWPMLSLSEPNSAQ